MVGRRSFPFGMPFLYITLETCQSRRWNSSKLSSKASSRRWDGSIHWSSERKPIIWDMTPVFFDKDYKIKVYIYNWFLIDLVFSTGKNHQNNMGPPCSVLRILGKVLAELNATPRETFPDLQLVVIRGDRFGWSCWGRFLEFGRMISQVIFVAIGLLEWSGFD